MTTPNTTSPNPTAAPAASRLWKAGGFVEDPYVAIDDAAAIQTGQSPLVSLARWRAEHAPLAAGGAPVAVQVEPTATIDPATDALASIAAIVIPFAKFTDGRGYSLARRLREELHFAGEIRATGDVLIDQIPLMLRCGFDAFVIRHQPTLRLLEAGHIPSIPEVYQNAVRGRARTVLAAPSAP